MFVLWVELYVKHRRLWSDCVNVQAGLLLHWIADFTRTFYEYLRSLFGHKFHWPMEVGIKKKKKKKRKWPRPVFEIILAEAKCFLAKKKKKKKKKEAYPLPYKTTKNENFLIKNSDFLPISAQNIDCGYSLEPPRRGGSNEYPQSMFLIRNQKNNVYPFKPQFYYIKLSNKSEVPFVFCTAKAVHILSAKI